jgi:RNA 3'-terminal phosphate cyclase (ATP)
MIEIDGSYGEGGGQILRTALALSAFLRRPLRIRHIRGKRKNPGMKPQHLTSVEALGRIAGAKVEGKTMGSQTLSFIPKEISPGDYQFGIGTAGSITLLLQALLLPLSQSAKNSRLILEGGTHVPWSPPFHYLQEVLFPTLRRLGVSVRGRLERWGWYPRGGGVLCVEIDPGFGYHPLSLVNRGGLKKIRGLSAASNLPRSIVERQRDEILRRIQKGMNVEGEISLLPDAPAVGQGSFLFLVAEFEEGTAGFSALGQRGKPAEEVAKEAFLSLQNYMESEGCVDPYLADQLVPFMALARGMSSFTTSRITEHLLTNLWVVQQFLDVKIARQGEKGSWGKIELFNE